MFLPYILSLILILDHSLRRLGTPSACLEVFYSPPRKRSMATATFSSLPAELHTSIANQCDNNDLINLCLTSKWVNERCLPALYRHVDLQFDRYNLGVVDSQDQMLDALVKRQQQFVHTMLDHPEYGKHVRSLKGKLCIPGFDDIHDFGDDLISEEDLWRAMQSLTQVQRVDVAAITIVDYSMKVPNMDFTTGLFQSATSIRLVGCVQYGLAKSILQAINPATLKNLCLDMVQDPKLKPRFGSRPGDTGEDGRLIAMGATSGLLTELTSRCTALQTLVLRRIGQIKVGDGWHAAAEEESYVEWASFIGSVRGTLQEFTFEQAAGWLRHYCQYRYEARPASRIMDERFRRLVLPTIVSEKWPCLTKMDLRGVREDEKTSLPMVLGAILGEDAEVVVEEEARFVYDYREPYRWN